MGDFDELSDTAERLVDKEKVADALGELNWQRRDSKRSSRPKGIAICSPRLAWASFSIGLGSSRRPETLPRP